jgi:hypothetical protein
MGRNDAREAGRARLANHPPCPHKKQPVAFGTKRVNTHAMANDRSNDEPLDLWSLLPEESNGKAPATGSPGAEQSSLTTDPQALERVAMPPPAQAAGGTEASRSAEPWQDGVGDWREALRVLQDALPRSTLARNGGEDAETASIAPEQVTDAMRQALPEITWRVLALLEQVPERGAILLTPLRGTVTHIGKCDLCGETLIDPRHFPPICERCGIASRLALGYLSLADLLCPGVQRVTSTSGVGRRDVPQELVNADVAEEGAPGDEQQAVVYPVRVVGPG